MQIVDNMSVKYEFKKSCSENEINGKKLKKKNNGRGQEAPPE